MSITADYQQDHTIYDTDPLDAIKVSDDLTVTANYSDGSSVVLDDDDYTLSGTLTVGTSTITVSYEGKTTTISVLVLQDTRIMRKAVISDLASTIGLTNPSFDSNGSFSATGYQTFSVAAFLETIKKITYKSRYNVYRFIFRKEQDGSFYGIDSTKVFKFTPSGTTKYTATEVADPTTITTRTGAGVIDQNDIATITIDGSGVFHVEDDDGDYVTLTNANVIGFWMSASSQNVLSYCEVLA